MLTHRRPAGPGSRQISETWDHDVKDRQVEEQGSVPKQVTKGRYMEPRHERWIGEGVFIKFTYVRCPNKHHI